MGYLSAAGLVIAATGAALGTTVDHHTQLDHHSGTVATHYNGKVQISHRQTGAVASPGKTGTLRCNWVAAMIVARHARSASGASLVRHIESDAILTGTRNGWCSTHRDAIAREVASRSADMKNHLMVLAREDHETLKAELDRAHGQQRGG